LFSSFLKPGKLNIPPLKKIFKYSFKKDLRNWRSHFGIYPFLWDEDWESSLIEIMGKDTPKIQIAPVLQKLIFPRSKEVLLKWLENIKSFEDMEYLIPAHFTAPIKFTIEDCQKLINEINSQNWDKLPEDNKFLMGLYKKLFELGIIPEEVNLKNYYTSIDMFSSFLRVCSSSFLCSICLKKYPVIIAEDNKLAMLSFEDVIFTSN